MTITLESIKAEHSRISDMISEFEKQRAERPALYFPETTISLRPGEEYAGLILGEDGKPSYHLILIPGDVDGKSWSDAKSWAAEQGGELPTRREQSLLFANLKSNFEARWYWSAEEYETNDAYAWYQYFFDGNQYGNHKGDYYCRARAVRRQTIEA
ncbi:DUF1566 domain-containing protein [Paraburkholderia silviterrae]|uniref:DUF1566 domain-containing protein n=1 Tax=Paraburkholderia silviterrae TaxID=2528715 RepID=A0A4R5MF82_9BURK|nr:DUF1566 domain-containing protein [Paraburkholderia silviterrae]TDG25903.1 DUF1566 domain-containing protein [Paraburkholderia silviterrae]